MLRVVLEGDAGPTRAGGSMQVWCPMCEYLGLGAFKAELEDLCFAVLQPKVFREVYDAREALLAKGTGRSRSRKKVCSLPSCSAGDGGLRMCTCMLLRAEAPP